MTTESGQEPSRMVDQIILKSKKLLVVMVTRFTTLTPMRLKKITFIQVQNLFPTTHRQQSPTRSLIIIARSTMEGRVLILSLKKGTMGLKILLMWSLRTFLNFLYLPLK